MAQDKPKRGIQSVEIGGALLGALAEAEGPLHLGDLARRAGLSPAKAHPYLVSFGHLGLIVQERVSGRYDFGPLALGIGLAALRRLNPLQAALAGLADLVAATGHTGAIAVWGSHGPTVVHIHESDRPLHVNLRVGSVMSLRNTATGRIFAAHMPEGSIAAALAREGASDSRAIGGLADGDATLAETNAQARIRGLACVVDFPIPGISALSAPVFDHTGALTLAMTLLGPTGVFDARPDGPVATMLLERTRALSRRLGGQKQ